VQKKICYSLFFILLLITSLVAGEIKGLPRIIDGDTIHIDNNKIRLNGIDAPEKKQICTKSGDEYSCGSVSTEALIKKIENKPVICHVASNKDRYGRFIGVCFVGGTNLNKWMVINGYAVAYRRYSKDYVQDEEYAKKHKLGLWAGIFLEPEKWRKLN